jgi:hypothetical protein
MVVADGADSFASFFGAFGPHARQAAKVRPKARDRHFLHAEARVAAPSALILLVLRAVGARGFDPAPQA